MNGGAAPNPAALNSFYLKSDGFFPHDAVPPNPTADELKELTWYQLSVEWLKKRPVAGQQVTIRGDIENEYILDPSKYAPNDDKKNVINLANRIWNEIKRRTATDSKGIGLLWDKNTVLEGKTTGQWSSVLNHYRNEINQLQTSSQQKVNKNKLHIILYNICGVYDFGTAKAGSKLTAKLKDSNVMKGIVKVFKKRGRHSGKLDITTYESFNYIYTNPFLNQQYGEIIGARP